MLKIFTIFKKKLRRDALEVYFYFWLVDKCSGCQASAAQRREHACASAAKRHERYSRLAQANLKVH